MAADPIWTSKNRIKPLGLWTQKAGIAVLGRLASRRRQRPGVSGLDLKFAVGQ